MSDELVAFLRARLDEGEIEARMMRENSPEHQVRGQPLHERWSREVEAKRAILELHKPRDDVRWPVCSTCCHVEHFEYAGDELSLLAWPCPTVRHEVSVWNDHPDYRQGWKP